MSFFHRLKIPLTGLLIVSTLLCEAAGYALQSKLPARARADGVSTPYLSGLFLYLRGERDLSIPENDEPSGTPAAPAVSEGEPPVRGALDRVPTIGIGTQPQTPAPEPAPAEPDVPAVVPPAPKPPAPSAGLPSAAVPQSFTTVDDSYFDDALFIGDSRIDDMHSFSGLNNATYFAKTGMSVYKLFKDPWVTLDGVPGELTLEDALSRGTYGKIYLMVGVNELGTGDEARFIKKYAETIDRIRALQPDAIFYVMGILSVTKELADVDEYVTLDAIRTRNADLAALADGETIFYIDVNERFADENYYLDKTYADGDSHLKGKYYRDWADFIRSHAAPCP